MVDSSYTGSTYAGRDQVRALIGDTDTTDPILNDYEIDAVISAYTDPIKAAGWLCRNLSMRFAMQGNIKVDGYVFDNIAKAKFYREMSESFFLQSYGVKSPVAAISPSYGGVSVADKESNEANTDNVKPMFHRKQFQDLDNPDLDDADG